MDALGVAKTDEDKRQQVFSGLMRWGMSRIVIAPVVTFVVLVLPLGPDAAGPTDAVAGQGLTPCSAAALRAATGQSHRPALRHTGSRPAIHSHTQDGELVRNLHVVNVPRPDGASLRVQCGGRVGGPDRPTLLLLQGQASSHTWWTGIRDRY